MPVPATINDLSTTAASNSPAGSEPALPQMDDFIRALSAFIAQLRDGKLNASAVSAFILTLLDDTDAAAARATLGIKTWDTGEWVLSAKTTAPTGTVTPNGQTIGNAASGATGRANADTAALFDVLWNASVNTDLPIQDSTGAASTRGASSTADFSANKRLPLPNIQDGDALIAAVTSSVASRSAGQNLAHTHIITIDSGGQHTHNINVSGGTGGTTQITGSSGQAPAQISTTADGLHTHTASAASYGGAKNLAAGLMTRIYIAL